MMERSQRRREPNTLYEGDTIYLAIDGEGMVHSDGFVDARLGCVADTSQIEGCLFKVLPKLSYEAYKAMCKMKEQFSEASEKFILMAQQAKIEHDINAALCRRTDEDGQVVLYGQTIQLQHVRSSKYLTSRVKTLADVDKTCMKVTLADDGSTKCWFTFLPRYKTRSLGSAVIFNDAVCLSRAKYTRHFLHLSHRVFPRDALHRKEVNMNAKETIVKVVKYAESIPDAARTLQVGKLYRLYHLEGQGYVTMSTNPHAASKPPYLRQIRPDTAYSAAENLTLKSLFVLEKLNHLHGGRVADFDQKYRLRHLATGRYLTLGTEPTTTNEVAIESSAAIDADDRSNFSLSPSSGSGVLTNSAQLSYRIEGDIHGVPYRIHNPNRTKSTTSTKQKASLELVATTHLFDQDCFRFVGATEAETQDACFLLSAVQHLRLYQHELGVAMATKARISHEYMHEKLQALTQLVTFLLTRQADIGTDDDISSSTRQAADDPIYFEGLPVFHRQEQAREIKLIDVLYEVLRGIRTVRLTLPQIAVDPQYKVLHRIHRLTNKVLVCALQDNICNKNYIAKRSATQYYAGGRQRRDDDNEGEVNNPTTDDNLTAPWQPVLTYMEETLDNIGSETGSKSVYRSLFLNNRELLVEKVDLALIKSSCRNIQAKGVKASGILQFLSTICSYNGQNIPRNQELIVRALYSLNEDEEMLDTRHNILIEACECPNPVRAVPAIIKDFVLAAPSGAGSFTHSGHPMGYAMLNKGLVNVAISWKSCANWFMGAPGLYFIADELQLTPIVDAMVPDDLIQYDQHMSKEPLPREWILLEHVTWTLQPKEMFPLVFNNKPWADQYQMIAKDPEKMEIFERLKVLANYYKLQLGLFAELLRGGCISAIEVLSKQFSYNMLISAISNQNLPYTIRNSFTTILHLCWLNRFPHAPMLVPKTVYAFDDVTAVEKQAHPLLAHFHLKAGHPALTSDDEFIAYPFADKFAFIQGVIHEIILRMAVDKSILCTVDANVFLSSLLDIVSWLVRCGFYADLDSHTRLCTPLIRLLDGRNTVLLADNVAQDITARYRCNNLHDAGTKCKTQICDILHHVTIIWRDFELWNLISYFKFSNSVTDPLVTADGELSKTGVTHFTSLFVKSALDLRSVSKAPLECICMDLMMYDDDALVDAALSLLVQLNTRREQVLHYLVKSILVRSAVPDVSIAATTKTSSQVLKELEYLVPLFKHYIQAFESPLLCEHLCDANQVRLGYFGVGRLLMDILQKLQECCADRLNNNTLQSNAEKQSILLELMLHEHVMKLVRMVSVDAAYDTQLKDVKTECCAFFKSIMAGHPDGQRALFEYLPELIDRFDEVDAMGDVLISIFVDNRNLCLCVPDDAIWAFMKLLNTHIHRLRTHATVNPAEIASSSNAVATIMEFFKHYMIPDEAPVKANQVHLFDIMTNPQFSAILLPFADGITPEMDVASDGLKATPGYTALTSMIDARDQALLCTYFEKLLESFSVMCYGKNFKTEVECQQIYPLNLILTMLLDERMPPSLRIVASKYLAEVFFDTDLEVDTRLAVMPAIWEFLLHCSKELADFNAQSYKTHAGGMVGPRGSIVYDAAFLELQQYIFEGVLSVVTSFFRAVYDPQAADLEEHTVHIYEALRSDIKSIKKRAKLDAVQLEICNICGVALGVDMALVEREMPADKTTTSPDEAKKAALPSHAPLHRTKSREIRVGALQKPASRLGGVLAGTAAATKFDQFKLAVISNTEIAAAVLDEFRDMVATIEDIESLTNKTPGSEANPMEGRANTITPTLFCSRIVKFIELNPSSDCVVYAIEALLQWISTKFLTEEVKKKLQTVEIEEARETYKETQAFMASCGAAKLVLNLIAGGYKANLVLKAIEFGIEMLNGGNLTVQTIFYNSMKDGDERLFLQIDQILQFAVEQVKDMRRSVKYINETRQNRVGAATTPSANDGVVVAADKSNSPVSGDILVKFLSLLIKGHYLNMQHVMLDQSYVGHANSVNILQTVTAYLAILVKDELQLQSMTATDCTSLNQCWEFLVEAMQGPCSPNQEFLMGSVMVEIFRKTIKAQINVRTSDDDMATLDWPSSDLVKSLKANAVKAMVSLLEGRTNNQVQVRLRSSLELKAIKMRLLEIYDQFQAEKDAHSDDVTWDERFLEEGVSLFTLATSVFPPSSAHTAVDGEEMFAPRSKSADGSAARAPKRGDYASESAYRSARELWKRDATYAKVHAFFAAMHCSVELWWGVGEPHLDKVYFPKASHCRMLKYLVAKKNNLLHSMDYKSSERLKQFVQASALFNEEMQHIENLSSFFLYNFLRPYIPHIKSLSFLLAIFMNLIMLVSIEHADESLDYYYVPVELKTPMSYFGMLQIFLSSCVLMFMLVISGPLIFRARLNAMIKNSMDTYKLKKNYNKQETTEFDIKNAIQTIDLVNAIQLQNVSNRLKEGAVWAKKAIVQLAHDSVHLVRSYLTFIKMIALMYMLQMTLLQAFPNFPNWVPFIVLFFPYVRNTRMYLDRSPTYIGLVYTFCYDVIFDKITAFYTVYLVTAFCATLYHPIFYGYHLLDLVIMSPALQNVVRAVTKPGRALVLTCLLGLFVIYFYTMLLFFFNPNDATDDTTHIEYCSTLLDCFLTFVHRGLITGGGIGEWLTAALDHPPNIYLRTPYWLRILFDLSFFVIVIVLLLNIIFGITIDTFGDLRMETNEREDLMQNQCFVCGVSRDTFDNHYMQLGISNGFQKHITEDHNMWSYLYFIVHLQSRDLIECTGPEAYVKILLDKDDVSWFPQHMAKCLAKTSEHSTEHDLADIKGQLKSLSSQMEHVSSIALD
ncbi:Aste57867_22164 [Aphanomyces stellatus]|uniref:Aste57867_22164 protein n=1 Tax=Aphanomyces stellatus TaxID=120398 RepID=A0A485LKV7_9STRA|nr:hypothetical protein As57867_022095 [Aphanomyces stellatus]VFT98831.1 Aste57867_22164 [Aphanomyces stellatus]